MPLTVKSIQSAQPAGKPYKLSDGGALYLVVAPTGTKTWRANFNLQGKQKTITYGRYPQIGLAEAQKLNILEKQNINSPGIPTFAHVAEQWFKIKLPTLSNSKHQIQL